MPKWRHMLGLTLTRCSGLPGFRRIASIDPEKKLPASSVVELLEQSASRSGRSDFGLLLAQCRTFASLGPVSLLLEHLPTMWDVVQAATEHRRHFNDILIFGTEEIGGSEMLKIELMSRLCLSPGMHADDWRRTGRASRSIAPRLVSAIGALHSCRTARGSRVQALLPGSRDIRISFQRIHVIARVTDGAPALGQRNHGHACPPLVEARSASPWNNAPQVKGSAGRSSYCFRAGRPRWPR